eukprot:scaffold4886_cov123-Isochrysis_galbana.AAC.18
MTVLMTCCRWERRQSRQRTERAVGALDNRPFYNPCSDSAFGGILVCWLGELKRQSGLEC